MFVAPNDNRIRIKICGITNETDALAAIQSGADALGFNLYERSARYLDIKDARAWIAKLPTEICKVAVMVDPSWDEACRTAALPFIDLLQLHGRESPEFCNRLANAKIRFAKAIPVDSEQPVVEPSNFHTALVVLDSRVDGIFGGTGRVFPWPLARRFVAGHPDLDVFLAGGLTPENVGDAVRQVRPFGVDVTSGVESSKGRKDAGRLRAFIEAVRSVK